MPEAEGLRNVLQRIYRAFSPKVEMPEAEGLLFDDFDM
jgi:hypothetical protein